MSFLKTVVLISVVFTLSACSWLGKKDERRYLSDIGTLTVRTASNEPLGVDHKDVIRSYKSYLEVSTDPEMRVRVAHRIAGLKLQWDEIRLDEFGDDIDSMVAEDREMAEASIGDYEALLSLYPDRIDNDAIYYQLAKAYSLAGRTNQAIAVLEELTARYAESIYYLESQFRLGRMLYNVRDYEASEMRFEQVVAFGDQGNPYYLDAQYFGGWALFKQNRLEDSLLAFTEMIEEHFPDDETLMAAEGAELEVLNDSLRIMALMFDYLGDWTEIARFYDEHGSRYFEYRIYAELSNQYYEKKYFKSSASTLRAFVDRFPDDDRAPLYYRRLISGYEKAGYPQLRRKHKKIFIERFGVGSPYWNSHGEDVRTLITVALGDYIWDLATFAHGWGQQSSSKSQKRERLTEAADWYREYIRSFPKAPDAVKAHFLLAEISYEIGNFDDARNNYEIVAYQYPFYENAAEAGYAALLAYNKYRPTPQDALRWRQLTVASAKRFVLEFPEDERRGTVLVNTAEMLLGDEYYEQALSTARLAQKSGVELPPRYSYGASLVQGHSAFELGEFAEAEGALLAASEYTELTRKERGELRQKAAAAIYKQGEAAQESNPEEAVAQWLRLADVVPESNLRENAEYDAATLLMQVADYPRAQEVLLAFRDTYPKSEFSADIRSKLIIAYEEQGEWRQAAFELQSVSDSGSNDEEKRIAAFQSAEYFEKAEDYDNAIVMYRRYAHTYKRPFDPAIEAHYKLDQIYAKLEEEEKRRFWLDKIISLHLRAGEDQTDRSRYLASQAAFELGEFDRNKFDNISISLPLAKSIVRKNNAMQGALKRYTQAVEMEVLEFTTPSTYHIGEMYAKFSRGLLESERPAGMDELEEEEYTFLLEDQAFPLEEAAIDIHQTNIGRTYDGLYDEWVKKSFDSMAVLMPGQYDKQEQAVSYVDQIR
ncbi:MAG: tetratricopeptide repeat protein [Pseudomonadota bacterium]|nr:tetratricopeptide repeat protein [Pseudomonadota bacterium]